MSLSEFTLIKRYFNRPHVSRDDVHLGCGDDAAVVSVPAGQVLLTSTDTLVEGTHFLAGDDPYLLGWKALAVSLSDLAAMGATPAWSLLALTLPDVDEAWLDGFSRGYLELSKQYNIQLVGGDTTRGPLSISVQVQGLCDSDKVMKRSGAGPGDLVYVTGTLGDAALGLLIKQKAYMPATTGHGDYLLQRLASPQPRIDPGRYMSEFASAAIDVSDGLAADLGHILVASGVGASLYLDRLPLSDAVEAYMTETGDRPMPLISGEDYELCVCVPERHQAVFEARLDELECDCTWIGLIEAQTGLRCIDAAGELVEFAHGGFDHFQ